MTMPDSHYNRPMTIVHSEGLEAQRQAERDLADLHSADAVLSRPGVHKVVPVPALGAVAVAGQFMPGGRLGRENDAIAVVADSFWEAKTALEAMPMQWEGGHVDLSSESLLADMRAALSSSMAPTKVLRKDGDVDAALHSAAKVIEAEYYTPYRESAPMEPLSCTAAVTDDGFELWVGSQSPELSLKVAAATVGLPVEKGKVHFMHSGGSFGRRLEMDYVRQAVQIAMAMKGTPVKLTWTREDTFRFSPYQPTSLTRIRGGLDANGELIAWKQRIVSNSIYPGVGVSHLPGGNFVSTTSPISTSNFWSCPTFCAPAQFAAWSTPMKASSSRASSTNSLMQPARIPTSFRKRRGEQHPSSLGREPKGT